MTAARTWGAVWIIPGQPDDSIAVNLGFGRTRSGRAGNGAGFDVYRLRTTGAMNYAMGVELRKLDRKFTLATTQRQSTMAKREVARVGTLADYQKNPEFAREMGEEVPGKGETIYPETFKYEGYAWGMSIDLGACVGCNACVVACQAENNIAIVGKDQVNRERIMHWLRIDRYYESDGGKDNQKPGGESAHRFRARRLRALRDAPCELVCPVAATVHDQDGLNNMIYNRCVGTRYCSNNCPYKVRRFNFYPVFGLEYRKREAAEEPGRHGAQPRRYGKVHLLRAAHQLRENHGGKGRSQGARWRDRHRVRGGLPHAGDHVRRFERPGQPGAQGETGRFDVRAAGRVEHAAPNHPHGGAAQSEPRDWRGKLGNVSSTATYRTSGSGKSRPDYRAAAKT